MKNILATGAALAVLASLASPAFAASSKHRAPVAYDAYSQGNNEQVYSRPSDVVTFSGRVVGEDPDANIRTQILHDPVPSEY